MKTDKDNIYNYIRDQYRLVECDRKNSEAFNNLSLTKTAIYLAMAAGLVIYTAMKFNLI